jgi:hypothetical protein
MPAPDEIRLSESDVTAVLRRAGEVSAAEGLTPAQVQDIARSVGLSETAVERALAEAVSGMLREASVERRGGVPVAIYKEVALPGPLTDDAWAVLVSTLQSTFAARGKEPKSKSTAIREWRNGNLRITVEPAAGGHRLRLSTAKTDTWPVAIVAGASMLFVGLSLAAAVAAKQSPAGLLWLTAVVPTLAGIGVLVRPFFALPEWARRRQAQFDAVAREATALARPEGEKRLTSG